MELYSYAPLAGKDSIRLLEIFRNDPEEIIRTRLVEVQLSNNPTYTALSYTWGQPEFTVGLNCNDKIVFVTPGLGAAIQYIHHFHRDESLFIWIDQVRPEVG
jgi:hypothetical protein